MKSLNKSPIALFAFKRLDHLKITVDSLLKNKEAAQTPLIVFCDAPRNSNEDVHVDAVRRYIETITGFKSIRKVFREKNLGLANSIIAGVTEVLNEFDTVIVVEDDLETSPYFLKYMNDALHLYKSDDRVASIHGYVYPIKGLPETFFLRGADCWGWATWSDRWSLFQSDGAQLLKALENRKLLKRFNFNNAYPYDRMLKDQIEGKNDSWAIRWHATAFLNNQYTLYPGKSLVKNIGNDGSGTHCADTDIFSSRISGVEITKFPQTIEDNAIALNLIENYFNQQKSRLHSLIRWIKRKLAF